MFPFLGNAKLPESESHMEASNAVHSAIGLQAWSLKRPHITLEKAPTEDVEDGAMNVDYLGQSLRLSCRAAANPGLLDYVRRRRLQQLPYYTMIYHDILYYRSYLQELQDLR